MMSFEDKTYKASHSYLNSRDTSIILYIPPMGHLHQTFELVIDDDRKRKKKVGKLGVMHHGLAFIKVINQHILCLI